MINGLRHWFAPRRWTAGAVPLAGLLSAGLLSAGVARAVAPALAVTATNQPPAATNTPPSPSAKGEAAPDQPAAAKETPAQAGKRKPAPSAAALPVPDKERYLSIVRRNPFGLKDPPPPKPPEPEPEPEVKPSALKLTGISTLLGGKHAMFVLQEKGKSPVYSGLVAEGDTDPMIAGLQVIAIDPKAGSVRVNYGGSELLLDFKNNGIEPPKATVAKRGKPAGRTVATHRPVSRSSSSGSHFSGTRSSSPSTGGGYRAGRTSFRTSGSPPPRVYSPSVPSRTTRGSSGGSRQSPRRLSPAEQALVLRVQHEQAQRSGIVLPPPPPLPGMNNGGEAGGGAPPAALPVLPSVPR